MACASDARIQSMAAWISLSDIDWQEHTIIGSFLFDSVAGLKVDKNSQKVNPD